MWYSGENLTSNHLGLGEIAFGYLIFGGSQIGCFIDECNMEVGVIIFLKVSWEEVHLDEFGLKVIEFFKVVR